MGDHRARATRNARQHGRPWTADEDFAVMTAEPGTLKAVAARLGRTHGGVVYRRSLLRRQAREAVRAWAFGEERTGG